MNRVEESTQFIAPITKRKVTQGRREGFRGAPSLSLSGSSVIQSPAWSCSFPSLRHCHTRSASTEQTAFFGFYVYSDIYASRCARPSYCMLTLTRLPRLFEDERRHYWRISHLLSGCRMYRQIEHWLSFSVDHSPISNSRQRESDCKSE